MRIFSIDSREFYSVIRMLTVRKLNKLWFVTILKLELLLNSRLNSRWFLPKNNLLKPKIHFVWLPNIGVESVFSKITWIFFQKSKCCCIKRGGKNNCSEPSEYLKVFGLPHMVETCPEPDSLPQSFKSRRTLILKVNFSGNRCRVF